MTWKTPTALLLSALLLTACGVNDGNDANETALRNGRATNDLQRVHYTPGDDTGDFSSSANFNYNNRINDVGLRGETQRNNLADDELETRNITNVNNRNNRMNDNRIAIADRAAEKIAAMREVDQANVFVTDHNAYVAAQLENNTNQLTADVKGRISDIVKSTDRDINQVYVSVNPDFYNRTATYVNDIRNGRPVSGFAEEFRTLIQRIFPTEQ
ncbi:YhcN/YlaJ family sporulation lipoprotein [Bacillus benzoevorans]|uniref:YhcN/YlaJ family sporulation lipoprotein n=1 Tax=Bacillus benzoevorans TaxID=1456 RepID=A0A7X0LUP6_9BACI|nr:YhcN/YlaJ family sporulation lipoprotein [Bacillus benzoevorans]MBB6445181.1 YhcN/YlaJ family sporulation lipoprotein [Bacillus benzoevorans]